MPSDLPADNKIIGIRPGIVQTEAEVDEMSLDIAQQLVDQIKSGQIKAFAWVAVGSTEQAAVTAYRMTPGFSGVPLLGALSYVRHRVENFLDQVDHD